MDDIKGAITKVDIKGLINKGAITAEPVKGISKGRGKKRKRKSFGSRKGKFGSRNPKKREWINKIRLQRKFIKRQKAGFLEIRGT